MGGEAPGPRPDDRSSDDASGAGATGTPNSSARKAEPDARFTFANERTFLAWHRTALALVVAGLAIVQLLPPFAGVPFGRHLIALPLIALGGVLSVGSYVEWTRHQRALREGAPLETSMLHKLLAISITLLALIAAVLTALSPGAKN